ncbi:MAG TPA: DNA gyrase subunit A [Actinobacteria bacterium]|nr:DNA gyrase subunit A [Actinomycetota bacterium]
MDPLLGKIRIVDIEDEMKGAYIDYAMSVIVGRALPDVADGLKPVHRRILYAMFEQGMLPNKRYEKCAATVGEVLKKYHPHGDTAVYDTLVRMAQDFAMRYPLIDGQGNFGSVDGDSAAAYRYTEARLSGIAMELLRDIQKNTVDFAPNFSETTEEPKVLPARYPNLLVNGSSGIAVGMATNIPPHNLNEVIDGVIQMIDNPEIDIEDMMKTIKGPDFPTAGAIMGRRGIREAYTTGRGSIRIRGQATIEETKQGKCRIVITELPYQVIKARLTEKIAELVREKKLTAISDLRDESDRSGMSLIVELKRDATPQIVLNQLYKHTQLETSFGVIMLALVDGVPRRLSLVEVLRHYIEHQKKVITRRTQYELNQAETRAHVLEGLLIALNNLDAVIKTIRASQTPDEARDKLMSGFELTEIQAQAILDMRLQRLTGLEREKVESEYADLVKTIAGLKEILADEKKVLTIVRTELEEIKQKHGDKRRTELREEISEIDLEDLIDEEDMVITITQAGYIKRLPVTTYRGQRRGGRGVIGLNLKEDDFVEHLFIASTHNFLLIFSNKGKVYRLKVHELPVGSRQSRGQSIVNLLPFTQDEKIAAVISTRDYSEGKYLVMGTKNGSVKKTLLEAYNSSRRDGLLAIGMRPTDELIAVKLTNGEEDIILVATTGQAIRFSEKDVRPMGRTAMGVRGMNLKKGGNVLGMEIAKDDAGLFVLTENGYGKRTMMKNYPKHRRGGKGVQTIKMVSTKGMLTSVKMVLVDHELMIISSEGVIIRVPVKSIPSTGRSTQGVRVMKLKKTDKVRAIARVVNPEPVVEEKDKKEKKSKKDKKK